MKLVDANVLLYAVNEDADRHESAGTGVVRRLLAPLGAGGNLVSDAYLAALAVEDRCTVVSYDHDFGRFEGVAWTTSEP